MKKGLIALALIGSPVFATITCPSGYYAACIQEGKGSCRWGCEPDFCSVYGQPKVGIGGTIISFSVTEAVYPDECSNYEITSVCEGQQDLVPPAGSGYCREIYPSTGDN